MTVPRDQCLVREQLWTMGEQEIGVAPFRSAFSLSLDIRTCSETIRAAFAVTILFLVLLH